LVERVVLNALVPHLRDGFTPYISAFGDDACHRSEPDWHFLEKPIHMSTDWLKKWRVFFARITQRFSITTQFP
jgi:hypothetical protein